MRALVSPAGRSVTISFDPMPLASPPDYIWEDTFTVKTGLKQIRRVWSFLGVDQGNVGEFAIDVTSDDGTRLYQRSVHKESPTAHYDAWEVRDTNPNVVPVKLTVHLLVHFTGKPGRAHFELVLEM